MKIVLPLFLALFSALNGTLVEQNDDESPPIPSFAAPASPEAFAATLEETRARMEHNATAPSSVPDSTKATSPAVPTAPPAPGETPPGLLGTASGGSVAKVDFLQRSNLVLAKILENERAVDPFGMVMDPANAKSTPLLADQYEDVEETPTLNNSSLKSALLTLPITGVYPQRERIVIGARSFDVGGQFGMKIQDLTIRLRFEGIRSGEIYFKDMETREVTSIPFNPRPAEFEPLTKNSGKELGAGIVPMNNLFIVN